MNDTLIETIGYIDSDNVDRDLDRLERLIVASGDTAVDLFFDLCLFDTNSDIVTVSFIGDNDDDEEVIVDRDLKTIRHHIENSVPGLLGLVKNHNRLHQKLYMVTCETVSMDVGPGLVAVIELYDNPDEGPFSYRIRGSSSIINAIDMRVMGIETEG